jgi:hypothetical protein
MSLFPEHTEGNAHRPRPKAVGVIADHVKDENGDGATDIEDIKLYLAQQHHLEWVLNVKDSKTGKPQCSGQ